MKCFCVINLGSILVSNFFVPLLINACMYNKTLIPWYKTRDLISRVVVYIHPHPPYIYKLTTTLINSTEESIFFSIGFVLMLLHLIERYVKSVSNGSLNVSYYFTSTKG